MKLLLIQPPDSLVNLEYPSPPLGIAYLGSLAESLGWEVEVIVASTTYAHLSEAEIVKQASRFSPDVIGISIQTFSAKASYALLRRLSGLDALLVAGGPHASYEAEEVLTESPCRIVVRGEGEETFREVLEFAEGKRKSLSGIQGITYRNGNGAICHAPERACMSREKLDSLPFPARHLFSTRQFNTRQFGDIAASRGCPFSCAFCSQSVFRREYRVRSPGNVLAEMESLYREYKVRRFVFVDSVFTCNAEWVYEFCNILAHRKLQFSWACSTRIDCVDAGLLKAMKKAGCASIRFGIESVSPRTLNKINKEMLREDIKAKILLARDSGIGIGLNFILGFPWETLEDIRMLSGFIAEILALTYFINNGNVIIPFPGTSIYEEYKDAYGFRQWWLGDRFKFRELHLYQRLLSYNPVLEKPFFPLPRQWAREIANAYRAPNEDQVFLRFALKNFFSRYPIIESNTYFKKAVLLAAQSFKAFFITVSKALAACCPQLELRFWVPFYKLAKRIWFSA